MRKQMTLVALAAIAVVSGSQFALAQPPSLSGAWTFTWDGPGPVGACRSQLQLVSSSDGSTFTGKFSQGIVTVNAATPCPNPSGSVNTATFTGQVYQSSRGVVLTMLQGGGSTMYLATFNGYVANNDIKGYWVDVSGNAGGHYELAKATGGPVAVPR